MNIFTLSQKLMSESVQGTDPSDWNLFEEVKTDKQTIQGKLP